MANNYDVFKGMSLEDAYKYADNKRNYAKDTVNQGVYQLNNQNIRDYYGITEDVPLSTVADYISTLEIIEGKNKANAQKNALITKITNPNVSDKVKETADTVKNFSYNPNADVVYQSYADMYNRQGQSAAKQTMANLAASNMGRGSSYGSAATAQVQQAYAKQATDMIPQLAQQAYERLVNNYTIDKTIEDSEYNRAVTGYQTLADDKTRQLTDEQLDLNNQAAKIELAYLPTTLRQQVESGEITLEQARLQLALDKKYADQERQAALANMYRSGSGGGGSSGVGSTDLDVEKLDDFVEGVNSAMQGKSYYQKSGFEVPVISGKGGVYNFSGNIGKERYWYKPVIEEIMYAPNLNEYEKFYLLEKLGFNKYMSLPIDKEKDTEDKNQNGWVWTTPYEHYYVNGNG